MDAMECMFVLDYGERTSYKAKRQKGKKAKRQNGKRNFSQ
jgi:hypothetical protein